MNYQTLRVSQQGPRTDIFLNRPEVRNAFNDTLAQELAHAFANLPQATRVVVLGGMGKVFCAGADLEWMKASVNQTTEQNQQGSRFTANMWQVIDTCPCVVIGRVQGAAMGGGLGLIACCDVVVASEDTKFAFSEVKLGLVPAVISPFVLAKISASQARRYFITGEFFTANAAKAMELIHDVVSPDALDTTIETFAQTCLMNAPEAMRAAKVLIREVLGRARPDALNYAVEVISKLRAGAEGQEGLAAFLEKRAPAWAKK